MIFLHDKLVIPIYDFDKKYSSENVSNSVVKQVNKFLQMLKLIIRLQYCNEIMVPYFL